MFDNIIIFYFDKKMNIYDNLFFEEIDRFSEKKVTLHFFCLDNLDYINLLNKYYDKLEICKIDIENIHQFRFQLTNAVFIPYPNETDVVVEESSFFRSSRRLPFSDFLIWKAYEEGIWILKSKKDIYEWFHFDEIYEDNPASPIKDRTIYAEIEYPIIKLNNPWKIHLGYGSRIYSRSRIINQDEVFIRKGGAYWM